MESDGYEKKRRAFEDEMERLLQKWQSHTAHIGEWEEQMTCKIMSDDTLSDKQKQQKLQDEVYGKVQEMFRQAESSDACIKAMNEYREFLKNNELMDESALYNLKRTLPESLPFINLAKAVAGEESEEIEFEMPSDCIYDQIDVQKKYIESGYLEDYEKAMAEDERAKNFRLFSLTTSFRSATRYAFTRKRASVSATNATSGLPSCWTVFSERKRR